MELLQLLILIKLKIEVENNKNKPNKGSEAANAVIMILKNEPKKI